MRPSPFFGQSVPASIATAPQQPASFQESFTKAQPQFGLSIFARPKATTTELETGTVTIQLDSEFQMFEIASISPKGNTLEEQLKNAIAAAKELERPLVYYLPEKYMDKKGRGLPANIRVTPNHDERDIPDLIRDLMSTQDVLNAFARW